MAVPTVLTQASSGAPTLTGEEGSLRLVLNWALIELGWTKEYEDAANQRAAYRNNTGTGSGSYLKIWDQASDHTGDARRARFNAYDSMTDIDTGTNETGGSDCMIIKSATADSTSRNYLIIGDDESFWLFVDAASSGNYLPFYMGDIASFKAADNGRFMVSGSRDTGTSTSSFVAPYTSIDGSIDSDGVQNCITDILGTSTDETLEFDLAPSRIGSTADNSTPGAIGAYPTPGAGGVLTYDMALKDTSTDNYHGLMRGLVLPLNDIRSNLSNGQTISSQQTPRGARDCRVVFIYTRLNNASSAMAFLIDIESDWSDW